MKKTVIAAFTALVLIYARGATADNTFYGAGYSIPSIHFSMASDTPPTSDIWVKYGGSFEDDPSMSVYGTFHLMGSASDYARGTLSTAHLAKEFERIAGVTPKVGLAVGFGTYSDSARFAGTSADYSATGFVYGIEFGLSYRLNREGALNISLTRFNSAISDTIRGATITLSSLSFISGGLEYRF